MSGWKGQRIEIDSTMVFRGEPRRLGNALIPIFPDGSDIDDLFVNDQGDFATVTASPIDSVRAKVRTSGRACVLLVFHLDDLDDFDLTICLVPQTMVGVVVSAVHSVTILDISLAFRWHSVGERKHAVAGRSAGKCSSLDMTLESGSDGAAISVSVSVGRITASCGAKESWNKADKEGLQCWKASADNANVCLYRGPSGNSCVVPGLVF